LITS